VLLIDFDQSVILGNHENQTTSTQRLVSTTIFIRSESSQKALRNKGTRRFMARAISSGPPLNPYLTVFVPPTDINPFIGNTYAQVHPKRCDRFSHAPPLHHIKNIPKKSNVENSHRLW
jgi:hypothetical protein